MRPRRMNNVLRNRKPGHPQPMPHGRWSQASMSTCECQPCFIDPVLPLLLHNLTDTIQLMPLQGRVEAFLLLPSTFGAVSHPHINDAASHASYLEIRQLAIVQRAIFVAIAQLENPRQGLDTGGLED